MKNNNIEPLWKRRLKRFLKNKLAFIGFVIFLIILLMSIFAPFFTSYQPNTIDYSSILEAPSKIHIFGTDNLGRDVFSRVLYGGRISIAVGFIASLIGAIVGTLLGGMAGFFGGKIDSFIIRISEIFQTLPQLILILVISTIFGRGIKNLILIFSITGWMTTFRMVRNQFMSLKEETYVDASRAFGYSNLRIIFGDIVQNAISPVLVSFSINTAGFVLSEAGLSFLGLGVPTDIATWGNIINAAQSLNVIQNNWWLWIIPGMVISLFILSINFIGDGLRDAMDPKEQ